MRTLRNMKWIRLFIVSCLLSFNISVHAQMNSDDLSKIKIDNISDDEIKSYYQKALGAGLSESQMYEMLGSRGLPPAEIEALKTRIAAYNTATTVGEGTQAKTLDRATVEASVPMKTFGKDGSIFGSELFSANSLVFEPNLRIATPSNYILGPDDELIINVFGFSEQTYNVTVNAEGNIYIPNVGPVYVSGFSIEEASAKIKGKLASTIYSAIKTGATRVQISLGKIRSIRVTVIGEARKPGTYTISSLTTLFNLLYLCGGPSDMGSYRNIELIRGNQVKRKVDIYNFLLKGDLQDNILLEELDVIRIPYYHTRVTLAGEIKRPGKFELQPGENFDQLLTYSGGFTDVAYRASINVTQLTEKEKKLIDIPFSAFKDYQPKSSDYILVGTTMDRYANRVSISGSVFRTGAYELETGMDLKSLLEKAGGVTEDAYLQRGIVFRLNSDMSPTTVSFSVSDVLNGKQRIELKKEDQVVIRSLGELKDKYTVAIAGEVHQPGNFDWRENLTLKDLLFMAGGFSEAANKVSVEISRRITNADVQKAIFQQAEVFTVDLKEGFTEMAKDVVLKPFDVVSVRSLPGYGQQRSVYVGGEVLNRGRYMLLTNTERISDLVKRFGGFRSDADSVNITIRRVAKTDLSSEDRRKLLERLLSVSDDSLKRNDALRQELYRDYDMLSINLREAMEDTSSSSNLLLEDGDYISIARNSTLIRVGGEVLYPTLLPYQEGASMKYYIDHSGSYTDEANKRKATVIYSDGKARTVSKFLFFKSYPPILPRSEILVPSKSKKERARGLSTTELVTISSIFVTLGTLLVTALRK